MEPFKGHKIQGLKNMKESYPPGIFKPDELSAIVSVDDDSAYEAARRLAREEGIFVGMSAGAAMKVAMDEARSLEQGVVVALLPDGGERYLSTSLFVSETVPEPLRFYNTLPRRVEQLEPASPGKVTIYSCGPSLDGPPDLGLCRRMVFSDVLRRYLEYRGYRVIHAVNLGDIDDRTVKECLKTGGKLKEFTAAWEQVFFEALEALRVRRAQHYPRASEHVADMVEETRGLLEKGLAYEKLRSVYFRINRWADYGKLSGIELKQVRADASTTYDYYEKDDPGDFALFKRPTLAELKAGIFWPTPWGNARPGWHIECACMAVRCLGQPIDIHTASTDLTFPHGDNEIAIACGLKDKPLAQALAALGGGNVRRQESRAAGPVTTSRSRTCKRRASSGAAVRYWLLAAHYRTVLHYLPGELRRAEQSVARLNEFVSRLQHFPPGRPHAGLPQILHAARAGWQEALDNDLNMPKALGRLFVFIRQINRLLNDGELDGDQARLILDFMRQVDAVLAVIDFDRWESDERVARLIEERTRARQANDFCKADALRDELLAMGVSLTDTAAGTLWKSKPTVARP